MRWALPIAIALAACRETPRAAFDAGAPPEAPTESARPVRVEAGVVTVIEPACEGMNLSLLDAAMDARCAISDADWHALVASDGLVQEGREDDALLVFSIVNRGTTTMSVPLRFDDRAPQRAFSLHAELDSDAEGIYELAAPIPEVTPNDAGVHVHSARIRLPPGGRASAKLRVERRVVERLDKHVDAGAFPRGPLVLHVGQLLSPLEMGLPARISFRNDLPKR